MILLLKIIKNSIYLPGYPRLRREG
ncbi:MAG: hypothetical protein RL386_1951, partial [Bacteroidota bacterium]